MVKTYGPGFGPLKKKLPDASNCDEFFYNRKNTVNFSPRSMGIQIFSSVGHLRK